MINKNNRNLEIDLLRGLAIVFMLISHSSVMWLSNEDNSSGFSGVLSFIGSFAPVVFFFVTGMGYGLSHRVGHADTIGPVIYKAALLIVMDGFMRTNDEFFLGWDFLAFIGFSMLFLHFLKGKARALEWSLFLIVTLFLLRYILPVFFQPLSEPDYKLIAIVSGNKGLKGVSYWFTPWLIYSLSGFILGILLNKYNVLWKNKRNFFSFFFLVSGLFILLFSLYLERQGMIYFRWGSMSINFFIISFSVLSISLFFVCFLVDQLKGSFLLKALSISGISSLAVVPIHYFILHMAGNYLSGDNTTLSYYVLCPIFICINIFLAARVDVLIKDSNILFERKYLLVVVVAITCFAVFLYFSDAYLWGLLVILVAQLLLCILVAAPHTLLFGSSNKKGFS